MMVAKEYLYDFYISYARRDSDVARRLSNALRSNGFRTFSDWDISPGDEWFLRLQTSLEDSKAILFLISQYWLESNLAREESRVTAQLVRESDQLIIPIFLDDTRTENLPYALASRQGLTLNTEDDFRFVVRELTDVFFDLHQQKKIEEKTNTTRLIGIVDIFTDFLDRNLGAAFSIRFGNLITFFVVAVFSKISAWWKSQASEHEDPTFVSSVDLSVRFFNAAGRHIEVKSLPYQLSVPEPVVVHKGDAKLREAIHKFADIVGQGNIGFFVHHGDLPEDAEAALNTLRVHGIFVVPLSDRLIRASLLDGNTASVLHALMQQSKGGDNLFLTRNALIDRRFLFGRSELLARIGSSLDRGEHVLLTGTRKSGKTSFLNILRQTLGDRPVAFIDLQAFNRHNPDWADELLNEIDQVMSRWRQRETAGPESHPQSTSTTPHMVVILDEFERILPLPGECEVADTYIRAVSALRARAQGHDRLSIIAADLRPHANRKNELEGRGTNPFFQFFQEISLPLLTHEAVNDMIRTIGRMSGIYTVEDALIDRLHVLSGGHPSISRTLASAAYQHRHDSDRLQLKDLETGLEELEDNDVLGSFFAENFWGPLNEEERQYLIGLVAGETLRNPIARASLRQQELVLHGRITIRAFEDWIHMGLTAGYLESTT